MDNQGLFDEIGPSHQPVAGQLALAEAIRREQAKAAAEAAAVKQLTPMGSKSPAQRQKEQMMLAMILRARQAEIPQQMAPPQGAPQLPPMLAQ